MKKIIFCSFIFFLIGFWFARLFVVSQSQNSTNKYKRVVEKPLLVYTFENLKKYSFASSHLSLGKTIQENEEYRTQVFYFQVPLKPGEKNSATVSGVLNTPVKSGVYPLIILLRGYVPDELYTSGVGTQRVAEALVKQGFITIAPDFLGYGESDKPSGDSFEARFQTYTTALTLYASVSTLNTSLDTRFAGSIKLNPDKIGIWAHSNGGQIALSTLAISGLLYPTVLWAPVSKSFPYSILYYTDETEDQGKALRRALSNFEVQYNTDDFSPHRYVSWIKAPVLIHQGTSDKEVPVGWSDELVETLKQNKTIVEYKKYPGADHNFIPLWTDAVQDSIQFYNTQFN